MAPSALPDNPRVRELLLLLWDAPDRSAGLVVAELPETLRDEALLVACAGAELVKTSRRTTPLWPPNKPVPEAIRSLKHWNPPRRTEDWERIQQACSGDDQSEKPWRVQLTPSGTAEASGLALERSRGPAERPKRQGRSESESARERAIGLFGGRELAEALGVHPTRRDAFLKELGRQRTSLGDENWKEVENVRPNEPRFHYRADSRKVCDLAARYKTPKSA